MKIWERIAMGILWLSAIEMIGLSVYILLAPQAFHNLVQFQPFNRHYLGDSAVFQLLSGLILGWVAWKPEKRATAIWLVALVSALHTLNHLYDFLFISTPPVQSLWMSQIIALAVASIILIFPAWLYTSRAKVQ